MTTDQYASLTYKEKILADLLLEISAGLKALRSDIRADLMETLKP